MYQILIADDEPIVCEGLRMFPWKEYGCRIVGEAEDGIEGIELLERLRPQIVITDIRMPGMNGIDFARKGKELFPDTEFIILTGYADFDYARDSLKIGIADYLLKPFSFEDIKSALLPLLERIRQKREETEAMEAMILQLQSMLPILREQIFQDLLEGNIPQSSRKLQLCGIQDQKYLVFSTQSDINNHDFNDLALYGILQQTIGTLHEQFYLAKGTDTISCVLCFKQEKEDGVCQAAAVNFCRLIREKVEGICHFSISIGISQVDSDIFKLYQLRKQSITALNEKYMIGGDLIMLYSDIKENHESSIPDYMPLEKSLQKCLINKDYEGICQNFQRIADEIIPVCESADTARTMLIAVVYNAVHFMAVSSLNVKICWQELNQLFLLENMDGFVLRCKKILTELPIGESDTARQYITDKILAYIEQNYEKDVSLDTLSRQLNYSITYLSRLIKKNCGKNFTELLLECRINRAKELLKTSGQKINQIAKNVGYGDFSYFIQIFKKKTGVTPSEYRAMYYMERELKEE